MEKFTKFIEDKLFSKLFKFHEVDFTRQWYKVINPYWFHVIFSSAIIIGERIIEAYIPFAISGIINGNYPFWYLIVLLIIGLIISPIGYNYAGRVEAQLVSDIDLSINKLILEIDPIYHVTKSSSTFIAKLKRGIGSFYAIIFSIAIDFPSKLVFVIISIISLFLIRWDIGLVALFISLLAVIANYIFTIKFIKKYKEEFNKVDDVYVSTLLDNINNAVLIRSTFASTDRKILLDKWQKKHMIAAFNKNYMFSLGYQVPKFIFTICIIVVSYTVYNLYLQGGVNLASAIASISTFAYGITQIIGLGNSFSKFYANIKDVDNLFVYTSELGKNTYPVFKTDNLNLEDKKN